MEALVVGTTRAPPRSGLGATGRRTIRSNVCLRVEAAHADNHGLPVRQIRSEIAPCRAAWKRSDNIKRVLTQGRVAALLTAFRGLRAKNAPWVEMEADDAEAWWCRVGCTILAHVGRVLTTSRRTMLTPTCGWIAGPARSSRSSAQLATRTPPMKCANLPACSARITTSRSYRQTLSIARTIAGDRRCVPIARRGGSHVDTVRRVRWPV